MFLQDLVLNNLRGPICYKAQPSLGVFTRFNG